MNDQPYSYHLTERQLDVVHLCDKDGRYCFIKCSSILKNCDKQLLKHADEYHIYGGTDWKYKSRHTLVDAIVLFETAKGHRQGGSTKKELLNCLGSLGRH